MGAKAGAGAILALLGWAGVLGMASPALAQPDPAGDLNKCLDQQVARLAPSGDSSDIIGRAALYRCRDELLNFQRERGVLGGPDVERLALDASITRAVEFKAAQRTRLSGQPQSGRPR